MSDPMREEDQVLRLICVGIAFLGTVIKGLPASPAKISQACADAVKAGLLMFETAKGKEIWPIVKDVSPPPPPEE